MTHSDTDGFDEGRILDACQDLDDEDPSIYGLRSRLLARHTAGL